MKTPLSPRAALMISLLRGPGYGLDIIERVRARSRGRIRLRQGSIYPTLRSLEESHLLRSWIVKTPGSGRPRTYYELTLRGITRAREELETIAGFAATESIPVRSRRELNEMRRRLERCFEATEFSMTIRRAGRDAGL